MDGNRQVNAASSHTMKARSQVGVDNNCQSNSTNFGTFTCIDPDQQHQSTSNNLTCKSKCTSSRAGDWARRKIQNAFSKKMLYRRVPILEWLPRYDRICAVSDLIAGITIALTVIPQGLAYSNLIGIPAQYGLYSSFFCCFVYIIFGTCKDSAIGPTAIAAMLTFESVNGKGPEHAILLCFLTGMVQVVMGILGLGFLVDFISGPVSAGFTSAGAVFIVASQLNSMLGITAGATFVDAIKSLVQNYHKVNMWDAILGGTCLLVLMLMREVGKIKLGPKIEDAPLNKFQKFVNNTFWFLSISRNAVLVAITGVLGYHYSQNGTPPFRVTGHVPAGLPNVQPPPFSMDIVHNGTVVETETFLNMLTDLGSGIIVVPLLGLVEDISVCKAFSKGKSVDATQELLALGLSNIANSFVQSFPVTGAMARSALNNSIGVKTTLGNLYTGILVIVTLLFLTPYFYYIPTSCLAAIIMAAAFFMIEIKILKPMWKSKKIDLIPGLATFIGCLALPLSYGILIGIVINLMFIMYHAARPKISAETIKSDEGVLYLLLTPDRCLIFPSVHYVRNLVTKHSIKQGIPVVIDCSHIYGADYTAATVIKALIHDFLAREQPIFFYNLKPSVCSTIDTLSPAEFVVYYKREEFDEMLKRWRLKRNSIRY